jgi:hypothetical protein
MLYDHRGRELRPGKLAKNEVERYDINVDEDTGEITRVTSYDAAVAMSQADVERQLGRNGFTMERGGRVIGEMPVHEYFEMERLARDRGEIVTGQDLKKWLQSNRDYMTVARIDTGRSGKIIIK